MKTNSLKDELLSSFFTMQYIKYYLYLWKYLSLGKRWTNFLFCLCRCQLAQQSCRLLRRRMCMVLPESHLFRIQSQFK
jgi:hypothetical protein